MRHVMSPLALGGLLLAGALALAAPRGDLVKATQLPVKADALRRGGVPDADVAEAVTSARRHGLSAGEAEDMLDESEKARKDHGPVDNFGAFVNDRLDEGLRGRELAQAIRAEHEKRGKGGKGKGRDKDKEHGKDKDKEHGKDKDKDKEHGKSADRSKNKDKEHGKDAEHGKSADRSKDKDKEHGQGSGKAKGKNR